MRLPNEVLPNFFDSFSFSFCFFLTKNTTFKLVCSDLQIRLNQIKKKNYHICLLAFRLMLAGKWMCKLGKRAQTTPFDCRGFCHFQAARYTCKGFMHALRRCKCQPGTFLLLCNTSATWVPWQNVQIMENIIYTRYACFVPLFGIFIFILRIFFYVCPTQPQPPKPPTFFLH